MGQALLFTFTYVLFIPSLVFIMLETSRHQEYKDAFVLGSSFDFSHWTNFLQTSHYLCDRQFVILSLRDWWADLALGV